MVLIGSGHKQIRNVDEADNLVFVLYAYRAEQPHARVGHQLRGGDAGQLAGAGLRAGLLPWDETSYWATVVGININGTAPFLGPFIASVLRGGAEIGPDTLARFYSIHMLLLPGAIIGLITLHLYLVIRIGVSSPPWSKDAAGADRPEPESTARPGLTRPGPRRGIAR